MLARNVANFQRQFRSGSQGVAPLLHRRGAGVSFLPVKRYGVALDSLGAQNHSQR